MHLVEHSLSENLVLSTHAETHAGTVQLLAQSSKKDESQLDVGIAVILFL